MKLTNFTEKNIQQFFNDYPLQINLRYTIQSWVENKKKTLPDWNEFAFNDKGEIFYRFLLSEDKDWAPVYFNLEKREPSVKINYL